MKKILLSLFLAASLAVPSFAATWSAVDRVPTVGKQVLSKNSLPSNTKFVVTETEVANSTSNLTSAIAGSFIDTSLETTALAANELTLNNMSEKDQMNADITGVDLMIQAGYNPLAMIVVLGKMPGSTMDLLKSQPNNFKRTMYIYDYLAYNYPSKVKAGYNCQEYKNFLAYIQPTIDERNADKKKLEKFNKEQAKLKKERAQQIAKYKATGGLNGWDASYTILKTLSENAETK